MPSFSSISSPVFFKMRPSSSSASSPFSAALPLLLIFLAIHLVPQPAQAVPIPMPFRRFFFLSAANPTLLEGIHHPAPPARHQSLANVERLLAEGRLAKIDGKKADEGITTEEGDDDGGEEGEMMKGAAMILRPPSAAHHPQKQQQSSRRAAALRGRVPMGPFDQWKRGGDFCGCNMGCFYHSVGQCASCCSLGL